MSVKRLLDHAEIAALIPHAGSMCLLDEVVHWDEKQITCRSDSHRRADNPLLEADELSSVALIEYAAQAAAIHAALTGAGIGGHKTALLGAVKNLQVHGKQVVEPTGTLVIHATSQLQNQQGAIYDVVVSKDNTLLITGRAVLVLPVD